MLKSFGSFPNLSRNHIKLLFRNNLKRNYMEIVLTGRSDMIRRKPTVRIRKALSKDIPIILELFRNHWFDNDPLCEGVGLSQYNINAAVEELWRHFIQEGMTLIAVPMQPNPQVKIYGAIINTKFCPWESDQLDKFAACVECWKTKNLIYLWSLFLKQPNLHQKYNQNSIFNIAHVVVDEVKSLQNNPNLNAYNLKGILIDRSIQLAFNERFNIASIICTGQHLSEIAEALRMKLVWKYPYDRILNENCTPIIETTSPNLDVNVFVQNLND